MISQSSGAGVSDYVQNGGSSFSAANGVYIHDMLSVWGNPLGTVSPIEITDIAVTGGTVTVTFASGPWDSASEFTLLGSSTVNGTYSDAGAALSDVSPGVFQATTSASGPTQFYLIQR